MNYKSIEISYIENNDLSTSINRRNEEISKVRPNGYNLCSIDEKTSLSKKDGSREVVLILTFEKQ